jgi:hypothetical protein
MDTLPIPQEARRPDAKQLISVWIYEGTTDISVNFRHWRDPREWGVLLADLARDIANDLSVDHGLTRADILLSMRRAFEKELDG